VAANKSSFQKAKVKSDHPTKMRLTITLDGTYFFDILCALKDQLKHKRIKLLKEGKKPRNRDKAYVDALNCLLANLVQAHLEGRNIAIGRRDSHYKKSRTGNPSQISAYIMKELVDLLSAPRKKSNEQKALNGGYGLGIIKLVKDGYNDRTGKGNSSLSLYSLTDKFLLFANIPQRAKKGRSTRTLKIINLGKSSPAHTVERYQHDSEGKKKHLPVDFKHPEVIRTVRVIGELEKVLHETSFKIDFISFDSPNLVRKFSPNYDQHGRIYCVGGVIQNWKREYLERLTIDDQPATELDYSSTHIAIAYALSGHSNPTDSYIFDSLAWLEDEELIRSLGKKFVNTMLNCSGRNQASLAIRKAFADLHIRHKEFLSVPDLISEIEKKHAKISQYFFSGAGLWLQKIESDICLEILDQFNQLKKPIVPKHDSFVVKRSDRSVLKAAMESAWRKVIGLRMGKEESEIQTPRITIKF
jgi:hypothetical protein